MKILSPSFKKVTVRRGETVEICLEGDPSTGYMWALDVDKGAVDLLGKSYQSVVPRKIGDPLTDTRVYEKFTLRAHAKGQVRLKAEHRHHWTGKRPGSRSYSFTLKVTD